MFDISDERQDVSGWALRNVYLEDLIGQANLSRQEKTVLYLVICEDTLQKEVAEQLGTSQSNVSRIKNNALRKLRVVAKVA